MITLFLLSSFVDAHRAKKHYQSKWQSMNIERHALADKGRKAYKRKEGQFKAAREGWRGEPQQQEQQIGR